MKGQNCGLGSLRFFHAFIQMDDLEKVRGAFFNRRGFLLGEAI